MDALPFALATMRSLTRLDVFDNSFAGNVTCLLVRHLHGLPLVTLDLSHNTIRLESDPNPAICVSALQSLVNLRRLNVAWCFFAEEGDEGRFADGLRPLTSLTALDISHNYLHYKLVDKLSHVLNDCLSQLVELRARFSRYIYAPREVREEGYSDDMFRWDEGYIGMELGDVRLPCIEVLDASAGDHMYGAPMDRLRVLCIAHVDKYTVDCFSPVHDHIPYKLQQLDISGAFTRWKFATRCSSCSKCSGSKSGDGLMVP